jgi:hypothetical protein
MAGLPGIVPLKSEMMGNARPALLVKTLSNREPLNINPSPTSLLDIAGMFLSIVDSGETGFEHPEDQGEDTGSFERFFYHYSVKKIRRLDRQPIPFDTYRVSGPVNRSTSWQLYDIHSDQAAPAQFPVISHRTAGGFMRGIRFNPALPDKELAWLDHRQFGLLFSVDDPPASGLELVLVMHIPEWIGVQSVSTRFNQSEPGPAFTISTTEKFWQEVKISLPAEMIRAGNNFLAVDFERLVNSPSAPRLMAAGLLKSIRIEPATPVQQAQSPP